MKTEQSIKHAEWYAMHFGDLAKVIYETAFSHGYKHGKEENE